jgi:hypothetical protein
MITIHWLVLVLIIVLCLLAGACAVAGFIGASIGRHF